MPYTHECPNVRLFFLIPLLLHITFCFKVILSFGDMKAEYEAKFNLFS
jgi:hypothetical protein